MLLLEMSLTREINGAIEGPFGEAWTVTWTDATTGPDAEGRFEGCARFNGSTSKISVAGIVCPPTFTLAAWVRGGPLLAFHYATILGFGDDRPFFGLHRGRPVLLNGVSANVALPPSWTHIAVTQDSAQSRLYVNGALVGVSNSLAMSGGTGLGIGCDMGRGYAWFEGEMARIMIFDEAISEAALQSLVEPWLHETRVESEREVTVEVPAIVVEETDREVTVEVPAIVVEVPEIVVEEVNIVSVPPPLSEVPWAEHVPHLEALHEAFPSAALRRLIATLRAGRPPSLEDGCTVSAWSDAEGGSFLVDEEVEATLALSPARGCRISLSASFGFSAEIGVSALDLEISAALVVHVDGGGLHQHVEFSLDMVGEPMRFSATPERLITSLTGLREAFEEAARAQIEDKLAALVHGGEAHPLRLFRLGRLIRPITR